MSDDVEESTQKSHGKIASFLPLLNGSLNVRHLGRGEASQHRSKGTVPFLLIPWGCDKTRHRTTEGRTWFTLIHHDWPEDLGLPGWSMRKRPTSLSLNPLGECEPIRRSFCWFEVPIDFLFWACQLNTPKKSRKTSQWQSIATISEMDLTCLSRRLFSWHSWHSWHFLPSLRPGLPATVPDLGDGIKRLNDHPPASIHSGMLAAKKWGIFYAYSGWWARATPLKNMSQLGWWKQPNISGKRKNGNQTTNQMLTGWFYRWENRWETKKSEPRELDKDDQGWSRAFIGCEPINKTGIVNVTRKGWAPSPVSPASFPRFYPALPGLACWQAL